jgi:hypothetical protein
MHKHIDRRRALVAGASAVIAAPFAALPAAAAPTEPDPIYRALDRVP